MMRTIPISERFVSIQGEGIFTGVPSSFVRTSGCHLRCVWCDEPQTSWKAWATTATLADLVRWCSRGPRHVVITGGEPMLFPATVDLCRALQSAGHHVTIETSGTRWLDGLEADLVSLAPKLRHSTPILDARWGPHHEASRLQPEVLRRFVADYDWQLKFVVRAADAELLAEDVDEAEGVLRGLGLPDEHSERVFLVPEGTDAEALHAGYRHLVPVVAANGMRIGTRLHIDLFGHTRGT